MHVNCLKNIDHANYSLTLDDFKVETPQPHMSTTAHKIENSINIAVPLQKWLHKYMLPNMKGREYTFLVRMIHTRIPGQPRELASDNAANTLCSWHIDLPDAESPGSTILLERQHVQGNSVLGKSDFHRHGVLQP